MLGLVEAISILLLFRCSTSKNLTKEKALQMQIKN